MKNAPFTIHLNEQIFCFELSSFEWSQHLICIAVKSKLILGIVKFPEETESEQFEWTPVKEIINDTRCHAISFAPESSLVVLPKVVKLCFAGSDFVLRILRSDLQNDDTIQELREHTGYINDVAWDPEGKFLASVSDDQTCIVWNSHDEFESKTTLFFLKSAGMSVKWHPDDNEKILVAEKRGIIHMYDVVSQNIVLSIDAPKVPLMCADWSISNRLNIVALAAGEIITWDLRHPCRPLETKSIHEDQGIAVRFSPTSELVTASVGRPNVSLKVIHSKSQVPQIEIPLKLFGGLCWHYRLSYVAVASDRKLCFWKILTK